MKLTIGENIRKFRKKNDLTQEEFADRLGVTYQSVSRWENGTTYPDLELLPALSEILSVTVDELIGMPQVEKEKRALEAFDELRGECMKQDYDADHIISLIRDIRRNYLDSDCAWQPWSDGNDRAFRDPKILPEVRLMAEDYLKRHPMHPSTIRTMVSIEDEEHLPDFLSKYTTAYDCSARALLFNRYLVCGDAERFEPERRYQLYKAINTLLCPRNILKLNAGKEDRIASDEFMETLLSLIRRGAADDRPDIWLNDRIEQGLKSAIRLSESGRQDEAIAKLTTVVELLEKTMEITDEVVLGTSCRFLDGMEWRAKESWHSIDNGPSYTPEERIIYMWTNMNGMITCLLVYPSNIYYLLQGDEFEPLRYNPDFQSLCERVKALIVTRESNE